MIRVFFFLIGFGLSVIGFVYLISYLNLLSIGYSISEYLVFVLKRRECIFGLIGFLIVTITIFMRGEINNDICI